MKIKTLIFLLILCLISLSGVYGAENTTDMTVQDDVLEFEDVIYFDASAAVDGTGTQSNPYKYLTNARIEYGDTAYFADGVYEVDEQIGINSNSEDTKVTFFGESSNGTIIKSSFGTVPILVKDNARLYVYDMTFDTATIQNQGTLEAHNVIFKNGQGADAYPSYPEYNDIFGGAIYSPGSIYFAGYGMPSYLTLDNCTFINNSAVYGGSIYHKNGVTKIRNSGFYSSHSSLYGGVLATDGGEITIENCIFDDCYAEGDAGGAIYAKVTDLTIKNTNFTNGYADFGGAVCNLNAELVMDNVNFINNTAKLEGGAIYQMYGSFSLSNSNISIAHARDGGAIFVDNCTEVVLNNVKITDSQADRQGGAIFSNANNLEMTDVEFVRTDAYTDAIIHDQKEYTYDIGYNSNYTMMQYNSSYTGSLPSKYSLVDDGFVTPIRDQQNGGNCWAFAGIAALESCILKATGVAYDLSEENIKNLVELYSAYGWKYDTNEGGHDEMTYGNLVSWIGPVNESDDEYDDLSTLSTLLDSVMHVQNVYYLPARTSYTDNDAIKKAILDYGAVSVGICMAQTDFTVWDEKKSAYYYWYQGAYPNHAVAIVGWDDTYSKSNFPMGDVAECDGAWIVKNSWGTGWGDGGYFYVSYCDKVVYKVGEPNNAYTFILNDTVRYNRNYQYDIGGMTDYLITHESTVYYKNTFTSIGNDILSAFSTYFEQECDYEVSLFINDDLKLTQNGHSVTGYYTIPFNEEFLLAVGDNFTIMIKIDVEDMASFPICEIVTASRLTYSEGISFFSYDGNDWIDCYDYVFDDPTIEHRYASQVACIKAFTRSSGINSTYIRLNNIQTKVNELTNITATVRNQDNQLIKNGTVIFTVDGKEYNTTVNDGAALIQLRFNESGVFNVLARYSGEYPEANATSKITVSKLNTEFRVYITVGEVLTVDVEFDDSITGNVYVNINEKTYDIAVENGKGSVNVSDKIPAGEYISKAVFEGNNIYNNATSQAVFKIDKQEVNITSDAETVVEGEDAVIIITLPGDGDGIVNVVINNKSYTCSVLNRTARITVSNLSVGKYNYTVSYTNDTSYSDSYTAGSVTVVDNGSKSVLNAHELVKYFHGRERFEVTLKNNLDEAIANENVTVIINNITYIRKTDENGSFSMAVNLNSGTYDVQLIYNGSEKYTKAVAQSKITVKGTVNGSDVTKVFRNATQYYAVFLDVNGNPLANGTEVRFNINGVFYTRLINGSEGRAKLNLNLEQGTYILTAINPNTDEQFTNTVTILSRLANACDITKYYRNATQYVIQLIGDDGKAVANETVTFNINGVFYERVSNGTGHAKLNINLQPGEYIITAEYKNCRQSNKVNVLSVLQASDLIKTYGSSDAFRIRLFDGKGELFANTQVSFNINGVFYNRFTNDDGIASLNINLQRGEYIITSSYNGSSVANTVTVL